MYHILDWVSFTVDAPLNRSGALQWLDERNIKLVRRQVLGRIFETIGRDVMNALFPTLPASEEVGRFPYRYSIADDTTSARIFFDTGIKHILVEISGRGCSALRSVSLEVELLARVGNRCSRLDVSADLAVDTSPLEFVEAGFSDKFKSTSQHVSETGQTVYIGSPKSDRQAAIYRYWPPHPRADFLRVEHRFRRERAVQMASYVVEHGLLKAVAVCGQTWGWQHEVWEPGQLEVEPMPNLGVSAQNGAVVNWLLKQVFPAMRRYERQGVIEDLRGFVQQHLFDDDIAVAED